MDQDLNAEQAEQAEREWESPYFVLHKGTDEEIAAVRAQFELCRQFFASEQKGA